MGAVVVGLILALAVPGIASAALNPANFYSYRPGSGSTTTNLRPTISVTGYDGYGVQGSTAYSASLDGISVRPKITYYTGYGYKKFTLTYIPTTNLSSGSHKVVVSVKDTKGRRYGTSWSFKIQGDATAPVTTAGSALPTHPGFFAIMLSATDSGSGVASTHWSWDDGAWQTGTLAAGPLTLGSHHLSFYSVDKAGNTEAVKTISTVVVDFHATPANSCTVAGCHTQNLATIHLRNVDGCDMCHGAGVTPKSDCTLSECHGPNPHGTTHVAIPSSTTGTWTCTQALCHGDNVTTIHLDCATCHDSQDNNVQEVVEAGNATCESCHTFDPAAFHNAGTSHTITGTCAGATCHGPDVSRMHQIDFRGTGDPPPGCYGACHGPGITPSTNCSNCHADTVTPHDSAAAHAAFQLTVGGETSTACVACHGTNLMALLEVTGEHVGCSCHAYADVRGATECVSCHEGAHAAHGFDMMVSGHNTTTYGSPGAKTKFDGSEGVLLMWESEETTTITGKAAGNNGTYTVGQVAPVTTTWDFPTRDVFWASTDPSAPPTAIKGLTKNSVITCQDCHTGLNASGPHGAAQNWGLDPNYPGDYSYAELTKYVSTNNAYSSAMPFGQPNMILDPVRYATPLSVSGIAMFPGAATGADITTTSVNSTATVPGWVPGVSALANRTDGTKGPTAVICAKCHDLENEYPGGTTGTATVPTVEGSNTAHDSHHQDQFDGSAQCVNCHVGVPHGWRAPRLLVNTDVDTAPYFDPQAVGTTRSTSTGMQTGDTRLPAGVFGAGFNRQGMQALSGVNNHTLGLAGGIQPYSSGDGSPTTALNFAHIGVAYWDESQCQACGDHEGENAPAKIITTE